MQQTLATSKLTLTLIAAIALCLSCTITKTVHASPHASQASTIDADGDDERTELLYHWQDKRFSDEERHQILNCGGLAAAIVIFGAGRRRQKRKQHEK